MYSWLILTVVGRRESRNSCRDGLKEDRSPPEKGQDVDSPPFRLFAVGSTRRDCRRKRCACPNDRSRAVPAASLTAVYRRSIVMGCAPRHSAAKPMSRRCSRPDTMVRQWLPASTPALLANWHGPYGI